jgi:hypothetical protein
MALNEKQQQVMRNLNALQVIPHALAGQVEALLRFGSPSASERTSLLELKARCVPAKTARDDKPVDPDGDGGSHVDKLFDAIEAFEKENDDLHVNLVRALLRHQVRPEQVKRAVALLASIDPTDEKAIAAEIVDVQGIIPDLFPVTVPSTEPPGLPDGRPGGGPSSRRQPASKSLPERGREQAVRLGWSSDKTGVSAS